jgi:hypothetical protein
MQAAFAQPAALPVARVPSDEPAPQPRRLAERDSDGFYRVHVRIRNRGTGEEFGAIVQTNDRDAVSPLPARRAAFCRGVARQKVCTLRYII